MTTHEALDLAGRHHQAGRLGEAEILCRQVLAANPRDADALHMLGVIACQVKRPDAAVQLFQNVALLRPDSADALSNLGNALLDAGKITASVPVLQRAAAMGPGAPHIHYNLANALARAGRIPEAVSHYQISLSLRPRDVQTINQLGNACKLAGQLTQAIDCFHQALAIEPTYAWAHNNLAEALLGQGNLPEAEASVRRALQIQPEFPMFHWNLGIILLTQGRLQEGWKEYAWRSAVPEITFIRKNFSQPQWDGNDLAGRRILLHTEQGFGDSIQFSRYLPMVKQRGGKIILSGEPELRALFENNFEIDQWLPPNQAPSQYDVHCPLLNLPMAMGTTLQSIPADVPYITADPKAKETWRVRLADERRLKVGIAWAGKANHPNDHNRSIDPSLLEPILSQPGVLFCSLQKQNPDEPPRALPKTSLTDWTGELADFASTAGLLSQLDLVICADTAVAHLAGAVGKPVWLLLPFAPDWRWMRDRADSPWYPTMRLFRQETPGDWRTPIERVAIALQSPDNRKGNG